MISSLKKLRIKQPNKLIIGQHNINSIRNKLELLTLQIKENINIFRISEKKLDDSIPTSQFLINGFKTHFRIDRNGHGVWILLNIREDIPLKLLSVENESQIKGFFVNENRKNKKK